jgi:hypothetical protein
MKHATPLGAPPSRRPSVMNVSSKPGWLAAACAVALGAASLGCQQSTTSEPVANVTKVVAVRKALFGDSAGGDEGAAAAPVGTGWATLKGTFTYDGSPPAMPPYGPVNKDHAVCAPGGQPPPQEWLVVDPSTKGIANIAIYARNAKRVHESAQPSDEQIEFDQKNCVFEPHVLGVMVNQPVLLKNSDPPPVGHNTNIGGKAKFNQTIPPGEAVPWAAKREEAMPVSVRCTIHSWMVAYMLPRTNGYFAVTTADGSFEIPNLPAGEPVEIQVWHEQSSGANGVLVVDTEAAKELKWSSKGRFKITLEENETREINIVVPPSAFRGA